MEKTFEELIKEFEKDVTDDYWETPDANSTLAMPTSPWMERNKK